MKGGNPRTPTVLSTPGVRWGVWGWEEHPSPSHNLLAGGKLPRHKGSSRTGPHP